MRKTILIQLFGLWAFGAAVALAQQAPASQALPSGNYLLSPGDVLAIRVYRQADLDLQCRIAKDGTIDFPLIRIVQVAGKTAIDASRQIAALLDKDYLVNPQVSVSVVTYAKQKIIILGQVGSPGAITIPEEGSMDLLAAIAAAGGFTRLADQSKIIVKREVGGKENTFTVDAKALMRDKKTLPFPVYPNDTISVGERFF